MKRRSLLRLIGVGAALVPGLGVLGRAGATEPVARLVAAGTHYHEWDRLRACAKIGARLVARREPDNRYDPNAVEVLDDSGAKIGYVPRRLAPEIARRMDGGEELVLRIDGWVRRDAEGRTGLPDDVKRTTARVGDPIITIERRV